MIRQRLCSFHAASIISQATPKKNGYKQSGTPAQTLPGASIQCPKLVTSLSHQNISSDTERYFFNVTDIFPVVVATTGNSSVTQPISYCTR